MKKFLLFALLISFGIIYSQDKSGEDTNYLNDNVLDFIYKSHPMVEVSYGYGTPETKVASFLFRHIGNWDLKLGKSKQKSFNGFLVDLNERYIFTSYLSSEIENISNRDIGITTSMYRFGFGTRDGIGFGKPNFSVVPYIAQDFVWSKLVEYEAFETTLHLENPIYASNVLNEYNGNFRFGDKTAYGIKIELASMLQLNANYETSVVYRRHLFWYWSGSYLISQMGYNALSCFTDELIDNSPVIGTVFNFLLKAGYQYGYYLVRQENMNWPFNTSNNEAPLTFETFNVGLTFLF